MKGFLAFFLLFISLQVFSQDSSAVVVHKDPRIDILVKKQIEINEFNTRNSRRYVPGYRILVINTNDRNKAMDAKTKMVREFPDLRSYLSYQSPFYKLKVGDFKERSEAEVYLPDIQRLFSSGVYVVRDIIEVNPDKSGELQ